MTGNNATEYSERGCELRELFKPRFKTPFSSTKVGSQNASDIYYTFVKNQELLKQCVTPQGHQRHWLWRITGANGQCSTLMKSPDEKIDWSPTTDQPLPFPFSWVPRCITGGISWLEAALSGVNQLWCKCVCVCVCVHVHVCVFVSVYECYIQ